VEAYGVPLRLYILCRRCGGAGIKTLDLWIRGSDSESEWGVSGLVLRERGRETGDGSSESVLYSPCASNDGRLFGATSVLGRLVAVRAVLVLDNAHLGVGIAEGGEYGQDGWVLVDAEIWLGSRCCDGR